MATNLTPIDDCNFTESVIQQFETASAALIQRPQEDVILLNFNTKVLNEEINKFRDSQRELFLNRQLTAKAREEFRKLYVSASGNNEFGNQVFKTVNDLVTYVVGRVEFNNKFPNRNSVLVEIGRLDPLVYNTFENQYPDVAERLQSGPITSAETSQLIRQYGFDRNRFADSVRNNPRGFLGLLQRLLSGLGLGLGLMGSFCSLIENVFGAVNSIRDFVGNAASFSGDFQRVISTISPRVGEMLQTVQDIRGLVEEVQTASGDMRLSMQESFQLLANALDITMRFFDPETGTPGGVEIQWNFVAIRDAILLAIGGSPQETALFIDAKIDGRSLADFNNDGIVDAADITILQNYIDGVPQDTELTNYITNTMTQFMTSRIDQYRSYSVYSTSSNNPGGVNISGAVSALSSAAQSFGSPSAPNGGDFGLSRITRMLSTIGNIEGSIRNLISSLENGSGGNIDSILQQISQIRDLGRVVSGQIFSDIRSTLNEFRSSTEAALQVAEEVAVSDPTRTREIQENRQIAMGRDVTRALNLSAQTTSQVTSILGNRLDRLSGLLEDAGAVGVLNQLEERLMSVVGASAQQLRTVAEAFSPEGLDNGFNFNMQSSFGRFAALRARALEASSERAVNHVQNVVRGHIAQNARGFEQLNRNDVEFIALRFCNFAGEMERLYNQLTEPMQDMIDTFQETNQTLSSIGNEVTLRAIRAGAIRFPSSARPELAATASRVPATVSAAGGAPPVPGTTPNVDRGPLPPLPPEYAEFPTYDEVNNTPWRGLFKYVLGNDTRRLLRAANLPDSMGWEGILRHGGNNPEGADMLSRFIATCLEWRESGGGVLQVNSAYRPGARVSGSGNVSYHAIGRALDVAVSGQAGERFIAIARSKGFGGIGRYPNSGFTHIDTGPQRDW